MPQYAARGFVADFRIGIVERRQQARKSLPSGEVPERRDRGRSGRHAPGARPPLPARDHTEVDGKLRQAIAARAGNGRQELRETPLELRGVAVAPPPQLRRSVGASRVFRESIEDWRLKCACAPLQHFRGDRPADERRRQQPYGTRLNDYERGCERQHRRRNGKVHDLRMDGPDGEQVRANKRGALGEHPAAVAR